MWGRGVPGGSGPAEPGDEARSGGGGVTAGGGSYCFRLPDKWRSRTPRLKGEDVRAADHELLEVGEEGERGTAAV